jgi:HEAT repeat protein
VAAIGTIRLPRANKMVETALADKDPGVRLAAVSALAERKSLTFAPQLKKALEDETAEISFTAARALWDLGDRGGKDLLLAVLAGERKQSEGFLTQSMRDAKTTLRSPRKLVWMGAKQGAGFLFGPLGFGLGMVENLTTDESAPARALAPQLLVKDPAARDDVIAALDDKSPLVRGAVLQALAGAGNAGWIPRIQPLLDDKQDDVRYMAAAAIVRLSARRGSSN